MNLYTRTGDDGTTGLIGGARVDKNDPRIDACGTVDELNAVLGLAASGCGDADLAERLRQIQSRLFDIGADLAAPNREPTINDDHVLQLEEQIDRAWGALPELRNFILPGGSELAARLHLARTICRRAERCCVSLGRSSTVGRIEGVYLNRLADLLFALAREANSRAGIEDVIWTGGRGA